MDDMPRAIRMAYEYLNGSTLSEIGEKYSISRERVRQIMAALGLSKLDGGKAMKSFANGAYRKKNPNDRFLHAYGCTKGEAFSINAGLLLTDKKSPAHKYRQQASNAKIRGVDWEFTLPTWWKVWADSGVWDLRGRGEGYCMARIGDTGPYSPDNVEIKTIGENFRESFYKHPHEERVKKAISNGKTPAGTKKTHCKRGHALTPENRYKGVGACLACQKIRDVEYYRKGKKVKQHFLEAA